MADVYEVSTDYLLGHISTYKNTPSNPVSHAALPVLHELRWYNKVVTPTLE